MRNRWKDSYKNGREEFAGNKVGHSNAVHARIYANNFRRVSPEVLSSVAELTSIERDELSKPEPIKRGRKRH